MRCNEVLLVMVMGATLVFMVRLARADEVPALLRYAQQYDAGRAAPTARSPAPQKTAPVAALRAQLAQRDAQLAALRQQHQALVQARASEVAALRAHLAQQETAMATLRQQRSATPEAQAARLAAGRLPRETPTAPSPVPLVTPQPPPGAAMTAWGTRFLASLGGLLAARQTLGRQDATLTARLAQRETALRALRAQREADQRTQTEQRQALTARLAQRDAQLTDKDTALTTATAQLTVARRQLAVALQTQTTQLKAVNAQLADKTAALATLRAEHQTAQAALTDQVKALTAQLARQTGMMAALRQAPAATPATPVTPALDTPAARQAYATGVLFGRDVQAARRANQQRGLVLDDGLMVAGVTDALAGTPRLDEATLTQALKDINQAAHRALDTTVAARKQADAVWVAAFARQPGAVKGTQGVWYRVESAGDGARLTGEDTVDLVVTERLTDGTVVSDMAAAGTRLTERISALPPAFAQALPALKNHGSLTLVVPPALAYGDKGYPPAVPPGATMVYRLQVADVMAAPATPKEAGQ